MNGLTALMAVQLLGLEPRSWVLVTGGVGALGGYSVSVASHLGYRVIEAHDGPSALRLLERQTRVDLLFSDVVLPGGITGAQVAEQARDLRPLIVQESAPA